MCVEKFSPAGKCLITEVWAKTLYRSQIGEEKCTEANRRQFVLLCVCLNSSMCVFFLDYLGCNKGLFRDKTTWVQLELQPDDFREATSRYRSSIFKDEKWSSSSSLWRGNEEERYKSKRGSQQKALARGACWHFKMDLPERCRGLLVYACLPSCAAESELTEATRSAGTRSTGY